jgi:hypothetical protein
MRRPAVLAIAFLIASCRIVLDGNDHPVDSLSGPCADAVDPPISAWIRQRSFRQCSAFARHNSVGMLAGSTSDLRLAPLHLPRRATSHLEMTRKPSCRRPGEAISS